MNGHSVLLRHVGAWRGPPGHKAGPTAHGFLASQACSVLLICSLLSSGFWHFRPEHHQAASGLPGWPENTVSGSVQFWYPASSPAQPRGSFYHPNWTESRACSLAQMQSKVSLPRHPGQPEQTAYTLSLSICKAPPSAPHG